MTMGFGKSSHDFHERNSKIQKCKNTNIQNIYLHLQQISNQLVEEVRRLQIVRVCETIILVEFFSGIIIGDFYGLRGESTLENYKIDIQ